MITLEQIRVKRNDFCLDVSDLRLHPGLTLLVGKNGSGKSTLLQILATALLPEAGRIYYGARTIDDALPLIRSQIGFVPTGLELYEEMTPQRLLEYFSELKGIRSAVVVEETLEMFNLCREAGHKIKDLSQGKKQKTAIAQAFLGSPYLLLLDEPLNNLDSVERKQVISLLARYAKNHVVVVATHELNEWNEQMDQLIWMDEGRIAFRGTPEQWFSALEIKVWTGTILAQQLSQWPENPIIHRKFLEDNQIQVRMLAHECPGMTFIEQPLTAEDAYFIRIWLKQARRNSAVS